MDSPKESQDEMTDMVGKGRAVDIVSLDFSRAFDAVFQKILIGNLLIYELDEQMVRRI